FASRINRLADAFPLLINQLITDLGVCEQQAHVLLLDSMPIITCSAKRTPKVALELVDKSYCASKGLYYHGVKLHVLGQRQHGSLPLPFALGITEASAHDLTCLRPVLGRVSGKVIIADKAYADQPLRAQVRDQQQVELITPVKKVKNTPESLAHFDRASNDLFSRAVSSLRQPIESFFSWLQQKTQIQLASKVRSMPGLQVHVFGKIAAALCILMKFNP
ncbi:MAG: transposase, partial [Bacteroidota bacterium]|nr:transposase [Bacteroidota bacterium]